MADEKSKGNGWKNAAFGTITASLILLVITVYTVGASTAADVKLASMKERVNAYEISQRKINSEELPALKSFDAAIGEKVNSIQGDMIEVKTDVKAILEILRGR